MNDDEPSPLDLPRISAEPVPRSLIKPVGPDCEKAVFKEQPWQNLFIFVVIWIAILLGILGAALAAFFGHFLGLLVLSIFIIFFWVHPTVLRSILTAHKTMLAGKSMLWSQSGHVELVDACLWFRTTVRYVSPDELVVQMRPVTLFAPDSSTGDWRSSRGHAIIISNNDWFITLCCMPKWDHVFKEAKKLPAWIQSRMVEDSQPFPARAEFRIGPRWQELVAEPYET